MKTPVSRREVLAAGAASLAGSWQTAQAQSPGVAASKSSAVKGFRYCLNTSTVRGQKLDLVTEVQIAAQAGYDGVEPWVREIQAYVNNGGQLKDLKRRGLLEKTLVIWGGEFGRTPMSQGETGRDHSPFGFSMWLAGGGIQGGRAVGQTDEIGLRAVEQPYHVRDLHATILHQLGLDQEELTFLHNGREEMLTDIGGQLIEGIL